MKLLGKILSIIDSSNFYLNLQIPIQKNLFLDWK